MATFIQQKRETALQENTAQQRLFDILENLLPSTSELNFREPLAGDLDFSVLRTCGFKEVTVLRFTDGQITSLKNIPEGITKVFCPRNLLIDLVELPSSISVLDLPGNGIESIDFKRVNKLQELHISDNLFVELENLPHTLEVLTCDNNDLRMLDLDGLRKLKVLHCSGNRTLRILNMPDSVPDFIMDNSPAAEILKSADLKRNPELQQEDFTKLDVYESLNKYFQLKTVYETKVKAQRKRLMAKMPNPRTYKKEAKKLVPVCVNCAQAGGTIFSREDRIYTAICGAPKKCNLNIKIYAGSYNVLDASIDMWTEEVETSKEKIIKLKMDSLFNYGSETQIGKEFKAEFDDFTLSSNILRDYKKKYQELHYSEEKDDKIFEKKRLLNEIDREIKQFAEEYAKTGNTEILVDLMDVYVKQSIPETRNLRNLKYPIMEIIEDVITDKNETKYILHQKDIRLSDLDTTIDDNAKVMKFSGNF